MSTPTPVLTEPCVSGTDGNPVSSWPARLEEMADRWRGLFRTRVLRQRALAWVENLLSGAKRKNRWLLDYHLR